MSPKRTHSAFHYPLLFAGCIFDKMGISLNILEETNIILLSEIFQPHAHSSNFSLEVTTDHWRKQ